MKKQFHKPTEFQYTLPEDGKTILKIIEVLYPDVDVDWSKERGNLHVSIHPCYTWVDVKYKDGDFIHFSLDNHECLINGQSIFGEVTNQTYKNGKFIFKVIPHNAKLSNQISEPRKRRVDKILRDAGYKKPSFEEWWREYHTD